VSEQVREVVVSLAFLKDAESIKGVANALNELSRLSKLCVFVLQKREGGIR